MHATRGRLRVRQDRQHPGRREFAQVRARRLVGSTNTRRYHVRGGRHPLLLSWLARDYPLKGAYTRHEPSEPFSDLHALTQAHSRYHSCTDNTHSGWARPRYMRPHTERSSPFQALPLLVCALKYPGPRKYLFLVATPRPTTYVPRPDGQVRRPYGGSYKHTHLLVRRMDFGNPQPTNIPKRNYRLHDYLSVPP